MNSFFWSSGNLITLRTRLAWMSARVCARARAHTRFSGKRAPVVREGQVLLPQHPRRRHQTELRPEWQSECRFHASDQRARWLCAPTTKGFTVPMMSGERELSGRAGEKKGGSGRQGLWRNERSGGGRKTGGRGGRGGTESGIAKHG